MLSRSYFPKPSPLRSVAQVILVQRSLATTKSSNGPLLTASNGNIHCFIGPSAHDHFYSRYNSVALRQRLAEDVNFRWCLNVKCDHGQIHPHGGLYHFLFCMWRIWWQALYVLDAYPIVQCSWCYKKSCFTHQLPWHEGLTCSEFDSLHPELAVDQEAVQLLISTTTQQCTKCKKRVRSYTIPRIFHYIQDFCSQIERSAGCDHMTCEPYFIWDPGCAMLGRFQAVRGQGFPLPIIFLIGYQYTFPSN